MIDLTLRTLNPLRRFVWKPFRFRLEGKYFYRLIWLVCISVCVPSCWRVLRYYQISINREVSQFYQNTESSLLLVKDRIERELSDRTLYLAIALDSSDT